MLKTTVYDAGGNNNGYLDPGETVDLTATLRNIGGSNFTNLSTTLQCSDAYITISDNSGYFGTLLVDSTKENTGDRYTLSASASTPQGYTAQFRLITTDPGFVDTLFFGITVGKLHYFIWNPDASPAPGQACHTILSSIGYSGNYDVTLPTATDLAYYSTVFVCVGIYPNNYVITSTSTEAAILVDYVNGGGRMYLEGGDVWYYDPLVGGYNFCPLFGISASGDGTSDMGPVIGQSGTFTNTMNFTYGGENSWMDHIDPTGTGYLIFVDGDNAYNCGVANDAGTYRTVGTSFELGALNDATGASTRAALLDSIMHFFGISVVCAEERVSLPGYRPFLQLSPNPFYDKVEIRLSGVMNSEVKVSVFDASGRQIRDLAVHNSMSLIWDGRDNDGKKVANGIYFIQVRSQNGCVSQKVVRID